MRIKIATLTAMAGAAVWLVWPAIPRVGLFLYYVHASSHTHGIGMWERMVYSYILAAG